MNRFLSILGFLLLLAWVSACSAPRVSSNARPISHATWDTLLQQHVDENGLVDYKAMRADSNTLNQYLDLLRDNPPNDKHWTPDERMAYWINAYNAFTVALVVEHYPVASIKDIKNGIPFVNTVWDIKFIRIGDTELDLNNIEHGILRKEFTEPRVHFALVCASMSCPKLQRRAFVADQLNMQLDEAATAFFLEPFRNDIQPNQLHLSKLLDWYWMDFKDQYPDQRALVNRYSKTPVVADAPVTFLEYDWSLNEQTEEKRRLLRE